MRTKEGLYPLEDRRKADPLEDRRNAYSLEERRKTHPLENRRKVLLLENRRIFRAKGRQMWGLSNMPNIWV